jgi:hypothetical protein
MRFARTNRYLKDLKRLRIGSEEQASLELAIASDPTAGDLIQGTGGIRKLRFGFGGRGKRGGGRAIYFLWVSEDTAIMLTAYAKNEQDDLSAADRKALAAIVKELTDG